jgi:hypothetical protein
MLTSGSAVTLSASVTSTQTVVVAAGTTTDVVTSPAYGYYTNGYYTNGYYSNGYYPYYPNYPQYAATYQVTQTSYVTQVLQSWQTQFLTEQQTQYFTAFFTSTVNALNAQSISDPFTILGLIGAGAGITLAIVGVAWAFLKRPRQ